MDSIAAFRRTTRWLAAAVMLACAGCEVDAEHRATTIEIKTLDSASPGARIEFTSSAGLVVVAGASGDPQKVVLEARKSTRADTPEAAREALLAFEVEIEDDASRGLLTVHPRWNAKAGPSWRAEADLTASVPRAMGVAVHASSRVSVAGVAGDVFVETIDDQVHIESLGGDLTCRTRDGDVVALASGAHCEIVTRAGDIRLKLAGRGETHLESDGGDIFIELAPDCSLAVDLVGAAGVNHAEAPVAEAEATATTLIGRIGAGAGRLAAKSRSGSVTLRLGPSRRSNP